MRALDGSEYMPGLVGLNNMSRNDYVNVIIQAGPWQLPTSISDSHSYSVFLLCEERGREHIALQGSCAVDLLLGFLMWWGKYKTARE